MSIWYEIYNNINESIDLVCMFIGCSMGTYTEITDENNQQYPCFLNNFNCKKLIILIDPYLETDLKIEEYFMKKGNPLINNITIYDGTKISIRVLYNDEVTVYALNEPIHYTNHIWVDKNDQKDAHIIYTIINLCLGLNKKFILQDFSGNDTTHFYSKLFKKYDRNDLLHNIILDVTQLDGGCRIDLNKDLIKLDDKGNFIQEKFMELSKIDKTILYNNILNNRIDVFVYPICFYHSQIINKIDFDIDKIQLYKIGLIASIYNIEYNEECLDLSYINERLELLINIILKDIINSKKMGNDFFEYIKSSIHNRRILYESMKNLKIKS